MATLSNLLGSRTIEIPEENIETGIVYTYASTAGNACMNRVCWIAPSAGTVVIEVWGAGGSAGVVCCCGVSMPGNSGGYAKKTLVVEPGSYICGCVGMGNSSSSCCKGCSGCTRLCYCLNSTENNCICVQGGMSGQAFCIGSSTPYCCFKGIGYCSTDIGTSACGRICNVFSGSWTGDAYGGDVNIPSRISCSEFLHCNACCVTFNTHYVPLPPGIVSKEGTFLVWQNHTDDIYTSRTGGGLNLYYGLLQASHKSPSMSVPTVYRCYSSHTECPCYNSHFCQDVLPVGAGAPPSSNATSGRDYGYRGGHGAIRIRFIADE